ncbi:MAG: hypothetical protein LRY66_04270 [Saccharospirillaceae bacterium]|nr:hypothetical protein [Saccharospirillaceae bacterium]MCD8530574.1 hypothetical protein [Saccharospirillaceae bacterium]
MDSVGYRQWRAYSRLEFTIGIAVLALLPALLLPRYNNLLEDARKAGVIAQGSSLKAAVMHVHERWYLDGKPDAVKTLAGSGGNDITVSARGWPQDAGAGSVMTADMPDAVTATARCARLWQALLQDSAPPLYTTYEHAPADRYRVDWISGVCRYTKVTAAGSGKTAGKDAGGQEENGSQSYIEYNAANGRVTWFIR